MLFWGEGGLSQLTNICATSTVVVVVGTLVIAGVFWILIARKTFTGPRRHAPLGADSLSDMPRLLPAEGESAV